MKGFLIALPLVLAACTFHLGNSTAGADGHAQFAYSSCFFGCSVDEPMMLGTEEHISVTASSIPGVSISSSSPDVVSVLGATRSCCTSDGGCRTADVATACAAGETTTLDMTVDALGIGTGTVSLVKEDQSVFDEVTLEVAKPHDIALTCNNADGSITLVRAKSCGVAWSVNDERGRALMASKGVTLTTSDVSVVALEQLLSGPVATVEATQGFFLSPTIVGVHAGSATIGATSNGVVASMPVKVTN